MCGANTAIISDLHSIRITDWAPARLHSSFFHVEQIDIADCATATVPCFYSRLCRQCQPQPPFQPSGHGNQYYQQSGSCLFCLSVPHQFLHCFPVPLGIWAISMGYNLHLFIWAMPWLLSFRPMAQIAHHISKPSGQWKSVNTNILAHVCYVFLFSTSSSIAFPVSLGIWAMPWMLSFRSMDTNILARLCFVARIYTRKVHLLWISIQQVSISVEFFQVFLGANILFH